MQTDNDDNTEERNAEHHRRYLATQAALRAAWAAYQEWHEGTADSDDFLDWAAEEAMTW